MLKILKKWSHCSLIAPDLPYSGLLKLVMYLMSYTYKNTGNVLYFVLSTAAGCGRVSPERSSYSQENCCQRGGGNITISLCLFCLSISFQHIWSLLISTCIQSISRCSVYTVVCVCVWFQMISPLSLEQALSARDSLAKAIYGRAFTWLVQKLNQSLAFKVCSSFLFMRTVSLLYFNGGIGSDL